MTHYYGEYDAAIIAGVIFAFCCCILCCAKGQERQPLRQRQRQRQDRISEHTRGTVTAAATTSRGTASNRDTMVEVPFAKRVALYSEAFDCNKCQTVLDASAVVAWSSDHNGSADQDDKNKLDDGYDDKNCDEDSFASIIRALEKARWHQQSERKLRSSNRGSRSDVAGDQRQKVEIVFDIELGDTDGVPDDSDRVLTRNQPKETSRFIHPRKATGGDPERAAGAEDIMVSRTCVICFEDMEPGETIVWSENKTCSHVYHKDCIVSFFAHKKQSVKQIQQDHNPCPACRQSYLTVSPSIISSYE